MKREVSIPIRNKVISKNNLIKFSDIFWDIYKKNKTNTSELVFRFTTDDKFSSKYTIENKKLNPKEEILDTKKITDVSMEFDDYSNDKHIQLRLTHGNYSINSLNIKSKNARWVDNRRTDFEDVLESIKPQSNWFLKYEKPIFHLSSISVGYLFSFVIGLIPIKRTPFEEGTFIQFLRDNIFLVQGISFLINWIWGMSVLWGLFNWLKTLWPSVEFDFGPDHMKREKNIRKTAYILLSLIVLPWMIQLLFWLLTK